MEDSVWWVVTMVQSTSAAESMGESAVKEGLAACAQIEGPVKSIYHWEGKLYKEKEIRVVMKTSRKKSSLLVAWIKARHPYEVPEIVAWETGISDPDYGDWVNQG